MEAVLNDLVSVDDLLVRPGPEGGRGSIRTGGSRGKSDWSQTLYPASVLPKEAELRLPAPSAASGSCPEALPCPGGQWDL